jgi:ribonucleoside-triphosphate reductase
MISSRCIVDIMNIIGRYTNYLNGNRTAEIALGSEDDEEFFKLKDYNLNSDRGAYGWTSNNSLIVTPDSNFDRIVEEAKNTGEPGMIFLENMRKYGRIIDGE